MIYLVVGRLLFLKGYLAAHWRKEGRCSAAFTFAR